MVVVRIELWPHGDQTRRTTLGQIHIRNDGTGTDQLGNYQVEVKHAGRFWGRPGNWRTGRVTGFVRRSSPYHLLAAALHVCGIRISD